MEDRSPVLLASSFTLLATSSITFGLRLWVRGFLLKTWGSDDWLMTVSIVLFLAYNISEAVGVHYGTGKHIRDLEPSRAQTALVTWYLCELTYVGCTIFLKLSVGVFLHRVAVNRWHIWIIRIMMLCTGVFGAAYFFVGVFMCWPVQSWWIRKSTPLKKDYGSCISDDAVVGLTFAAGSLNSIADFTFGLIPFFIIKDLHMPKKSKRLVCAILTVANIACIATIIRMPYVMDLYKTDDWLHATVDMVLWCTVEIGVGITAACFATLRPLLRILFGLQASQWFPDQHPVSGQINTYHSDVHNPSGSSGDSYTLKSSVPKLRPDHVGHYTEISSAGSRWSRGRTKKRDEPRITERDLYTETDTTAAEDQEDLTALPQVPAGVTRQKSERDGFPSLHIRKNTEFSYTVRDRKEDEFDEYDGRMSPAPTTWYSEAQSQRAGPWRPSQSGDRSEDTMFDLPLQTHGLDK